MYESTLNGENKIIKIDKSYKSEYEQVDNNLRVNYNSRCNVYKNIKCTKYIFNFKHSIYDEMNHHIYNNFLNKIYECRYTAFKHFMLKNNIQEKIKSKKKYSENLTIDYNIIERVVVKIKKMIRK